MVVDLNEKTYFLITGASRGIGQAMAIQVASKLKADSVVVLLARNEEGLTKTKNSIEKMGKSINVQIYALDMTEAKAADFSNVLDVSLKLSENKATDFSRAFIIHNAGTLGDVSKRAIEVPAVDVWTQYYQTNLFSTIALNCEFFNAFVGVPKIVVNLSSKCAIDPFVSMSYYCSVKAGREMYFRVVAKEQDDALVLNYAPGAIDTDMSLELQETTINVELATQFKKQRAAQIMLTSEQTAEEFLKVLHEQKFKSGDHVDYWD